MKKFSFIIGLLTLVSCKSTKHTDCDAYGYNTIKENTTLVKVEHCHIEEESYCYYTVDTIRLTK
jgi:hypothetical protein